MDEPDIEKASGMENDILSKNAIMSGPVQAAKTALENLGPEASEAYAHIEALRESGWTSKNATEELANIAACKEPCKEMPTELEALTEFQTCTENCKGAKIHACDDPKDIQLATGGRCEGLCNRR